jgi:hypothetical protein
MDEWLDGRYDVDLAGDLFNCRDPAGRHNLQAVVQEKITDSRSPGYINIFIRRKTLMLIKLTTVKTTS